MEIAQTGMMFFGFLIVGWFLTMMAILITLGLQEYGR